MNDINLDLTAFAEKMAQDIELFIGAKIPDDGDRQREILVAASRCYGKQRRQPSRRIEQSKSIYSEVD